MGTVNMSEKPWNSWLGLHEGEMALELAEMEVSLESDTMPSTKREGAVIGRWQEAAKKAPEAVRAAWWLSIGRHMIDTPKGEQK